MNKTKESKEPLKIFVDDGEYLVFDDEKTGKKKSFFVPKIKVTKKDKIIYKMKNFLKNEYFKHFMFIVSIFSLLVGYDFNRTKDPEFVFFIAISIIIIFFLWKSNYFTRNKK